MVVGFELPSCLLSLENSALLVWRHLTAGTFFFPFLGLAFPEIDKLKDRAEQLVKDQALKPYCQNLIPESFINQLCELRQVTQLFCASFSSFAKGGIIVLVS